jgi:hypothetical protein
MDDDRKWYSVCLRICGDPLEVSELNSRLGVNPTNVGRKGEHIRQNPRYALHESDLWTWDCPSSADVPFETQLEEVLARLEPAQDYLRSLFASRDATGELFLGFSSVNGQGGAFFPSALLGRIASLGLSLSLDLYPPESPSSDTAP